MKPMIKITTLAVMAGLMLPMAANAQIAAGMAGRDTFTQNMIRNGDNDTEAHGYSPTTRYDRWDNAHEAQTVNYRTDYYDPQAGTVTRSSTTTTTTTTY